MEKAIIGCQTIGSPTEIHEMLHGGIMGKYDVHLIDNETSIKTFRIEKIIDYSEFKRPQTRAERRKLNHK